MAPVNCPHCSTPVPDLARSCPGCGKAPPLRGKRKLGCLLLILFGPFLAYPFVPKPPAEESAAEEAEREARRAERRRVQEEGRRRDREERAAAEAARAAERAPIPVEAISVTLVWQSRQWPAWAWYRDEGRQVGGEFVEGCYLAGLFIRNASDRPIAIDGGYVKWIDQASDTMRMPDRSLRRTIERAVVRLRGAFGGEAALFEYPLTLAGTLAPGASVHGFVTFDAPARAIRPAIQVEIPRMAGDLVVSLDE